MSSREQKKEVRVDVPWKEALARMRETAIPRKEDTEEEIERLSLSEVENVIPASHRQDTAKAPVNLTHISGLTRAQIVERKGARIRLEGQLVFYRKTGASKWERGLCRRCGMKNAYIIPLERNGQAKQDEVVADFDKFDILNDFEMQLYRTHASVQAMKKEYYRLETLYNKFLSTRYKGGMRAGPRHSAPEVGGKSGHKKGGG